jgi:hypothetical protein
MDIRYLSRYSRGIFIVAMGICQDSLDFRFALKLSGGIIAKLLQTMR